MRITLRYLIRGLSVAMLLVASSSYALSATKYYIDFASGSDSNSGAAQSAPWKHAPGMNGCSSNCANASPQPGDQIILKGGVTWDSTCFQWSWNWSGTSGSPIYIGVDQSWFAGASWTRPILSGGGTWPGAGNGAFLSFGTGVSHWTLDNFEWTGLYWSGSSPTAGYVNWGPNSNVTNYLVEHNYFHGWSHGSAANGTKEMNGVFAMRGTTSGVADGGQVLYNVVDGSDCCGGTPDSLDPIYGGTGEIAYNYFSYYMSAQGSWMLVHDNVFRNAVNTFDNTSHADLFQDNGTCGSIRYNNVSGLVPSGAPQFNLAPLTGCVNYSFNNIYYNFATTNGYLIQSCSPNNCGGGMVFLNDTVASVIPTSPCIRNQGDSASANVTIENVFCISANNSIVNNGSTHAINYVTTFPAQGTQYTPTQAANDGYSSSERYVYSPTSATKPTVGVGTNAAAICATISAINASAGAACLKDTTYGVSYNTSNHTVTSPARTPLARPTSGNWDIGAYQFGATTSATVQPPTSLQVVVQ